MVPVWFSPALYIHYVPCFPPLLRSPPLQLDTRVETPSPLLTIRHIAIYDSYDTL